MTIILCQKATLKGVEFGAHIYSAPFNVVSSVLPVILALTHDVDFGFLDQGNPQDGRDISDAQVD